VLLSSERSKGQRLFRYIGMHRRELVSAQDWETAVDSFLQGKLVRLDNADIRDANRHRLWNNLQTEKEGPRSASFRRLEAQLGYDPDEVDEGRNFGRLCDVVKLGADPLGEMASDAALLGTPDRMLSAADIEAVAERSGFDAGKAIALADAENLPRPGVSAWRLGGEGARRLRKQEALDGRRISDWFLTNCAGTTGDIIDMKRPAVGRNFVCAGSKRWGHAFIASAGMESRTSVRAGEIDRGSRSWRPGMACR